MTALRRVWKRTSGHAPSWDALVVGAMTWTIYLSTGWYGARQNADVRAASLSAWRLGQHGSLDLAGYPGVVDWPVRVGDALYTNRFPGVIAAGGPFYALLGDPDRYTVMPGTVAAATWSAAAVALAVLVFQHVATRRGAVIAALLLAFASPTWTVSADALWTHGPEQLFVMLALLSLARQRPALAGLSFSVGILVRPHIAVAAAAVGVWLAIAHRRAKDLVLIATMATVGAAALVAYNDEVFQHPSILGGYAGSHLRAGGLGATGLAVNVPGMLVSPERGLLVMTPFLWMLLPGLPSAWQASPPWVRAGAVGGVTYAATQLYLLPFMGGRGFFSYRTMIEPLTMAAPLLVVAYCRWTSRTDARRIWFWCLAWLTFSLHAFGATFDQHRRTTGDPFRTFSAWDVARDAGPWTTWLWLGATALGLLLLVSQRGHIGAADCRHLAGGPSPASRRLDEQRT